MCVCFVSAAGPRLDWDPDIVAGLDEDFDFDNPDNQLGDDFVVQANDGQLGPLDGDEQGQYDGTEQDPNRMPPAKTRSDDDGDVASDEAEMSGDEDAMSDLGSLDNKSFTDLETKSRFTSYSMSSSVIRRNDGLSLLDDRFEKVTVCT